MVKALMWFFGAVWFLGCAGFGTYFIIEGEAPPSFRWGVGLGMIIMSPWWLVYDIYIHLRQKK